MTQENKKGHVEESLDRNAQVYFNSNCSMGSKVIRKLIEKHTQEDCIIDIVNLSLASTFCQGVFYGWNHPKKVNIENLPQEIKDLNYLFAFNFHDNDFGCEFGEGAGNFCYDLNKLFIRIGDSNRDKCEYLTDELKGKIKSFISLDNLIKYIAKGVCVFSLNDNRDIDIPIEDIFKECKHTIESFSVEKKESYIFGSIKDVSEKVIKDNIKYQMEPIPTELRDFWLNGEYLFVKIENGFANAWVQ